MVEEEPSKKDSIKDKLSDIGQKVGDASKKAVKKTSEISSSIAEDIKVGAKKVSEDVKVGAKKVSETVEQKRDEFKENREASKKAKAEADDARENELLQDLKKSELIPLHNENSASEEEEFITIPINEYHELVARSERQVIVPEVLNSNSIDVQEKIPNETLTVELSRSMNDILQTLGVSVIIAGILVAIDFYVESNPMPIGPISAELLIWPVGTAVWSYFVLHRLAKSRTLLSMPLGMRLQTSVGIGLATELAMLLSSETVAITNIWGWTGVVALTAMLLSGLVRGLAGTLSRLFKINGSE